MSTDSYIGERKRKAEELSKKFREAWNKYPIKNNKIVFSTFEGDGGFCCNPKYIAEELHRRDIDCEMVWLTHDVSRPFPDYIKVVEDTTDNLVYHLSTAKVWIDNYRKPFGTLKREGQIYIQTWHASIGFKAVGLYRGDLFPPIARMVSEWDSNLADYFISNSDYCDRVYPKKLLYNGPTLRTGSPRVDCLINRKVEFHSVIRKQFNLDEKVRLLLFAPTFRGGNQKGKKQVVADIPNVDFSKVIKAMKERFGGEWKVLLRLHPQLSAKLSEMPINEKSEALIDVSQYPDISELMAASDMILTDYSSCAFDALFAHIPVLLFADDVQEYIENRGKFMWEKEDLPFLMAETNETLIDNIYSLDEKIYKNKADCFMQKQGVNEDGSASKYVVDYLLAAL